MSSILSGRHLFLLKFKTLRHLSARLLFLRTETYRLFQMARICLFSQLLCLVFVYPQNTLNPLSIPPLHPFSIVISSRSGQQAVDFRVTLPETVHVSWQFSTFGTCSVRSTLVLSLFQREKHKSWPRQPPDREWQGASLDSLWLPHSDCSWILWARADCRDRHCSWIR